MSFFYVYLGERQFRGIKIIWGSSKYTAYPKGDGKNVLQIVLGIADVYTVKSHFISVRDLKASCRQTCNLDLTVLFT